MIRPVLTEFALFFAPFAVYAMFLLVTRADVLSRASWPWRVVGWLTIAALLLVVLSFVVLAQWSGSDARSTYTPAHLENGQLVPGQTK